MLQAMQEEIHSTQQNKIYDLVKLLKGKIALRNKSVFKLKRDGKGKLAKYKAQLIVKGFEQKKGSILTKSSHW